MEKENRLDQMIHKKKRMANMELLRILAMMMVVMLHFLSKGNVLPGLTGSLDANGYVAWILETGSIVAVNIYMLIAGYFLVDSGFKCRRVVQLVLQTFFYSILIPLCMIALGILDPAQITVYQILQYVFPVQMIQYWFVTAYVLMYLFSPLLNSAVKSMSKRQLEITIGLLLLVISLSKSILPVRLELDNEGYDCIWFLCVYLTAAYIRLHGIGILKNIQRSLLLYLTSCAGIFGIALAVRVLYLKTGQFGSFITASYHYNHILNLCAAVGLFYVFYHIKLPEGWFAKCVCAVAPYTFGVYLLHEHLELRNKWAVWMGAGTLVKPVPFLVHAVGCVLLMFAIGILVDMFRGLLFRGIGHLLKGSPPDRLMGKIDKVLGG